MALLLFIGVEERIIAAYSALLHRPPDSPPRSDAGAVADGDRVHEVEWGEDHGSPGVNWVTAAVIIAEIGVKMSQWPTVGHLTSWAGLCPGQNESAGKRGKSNIRPGNPYLRSALVEAAIAATCAKDSYFREKYYRLKARRGHKRAVVAVAHKLLIAIYHVLTSDTSYQELGADYLERLEPERLKHNLVRRLERLGYQVSLEPKRV